MLKPEDIIDQLGLEPLELEGGFFRRTWCSKETGGATAIYFLVTRGQPSLMHRLESDEIWLHHFGDPLDMLMLHPDGRGETATIGPDLPSGQSPQQVCPGGAWQGTRICPGKDLFGYALVSCVVTPGFSWERFELGERRALIREYPLHAERIEQLTAPGREPDGGQSGARSR